MAELSMLENSAQTKQEVVEEIKEVYLRCELPTSSEGLTYDDVLKQLQSSVPLPAQQQSQQHQHQQQHQQQQQQQQQHSLRIGTPHGFPLDDGMPGLMDLSELPEAPFGEGITHTVKKVSYNRTIYTFNEPYGMSLVVTKFAYFDTTMYSVNDSLIIPESEFRTIWSVQKETENMVPNLRILTRSRNASYTLSTSIELLASALAFFGAEKPSESIECSHECDC